MLVSCRLSSGCLCFRKVFGKVAYVLERFWVIFAYVLENFRIFAPKLVCHDNYVRKRTYKTTETME